MRHIPAEKKCTELTRLQQGFRSSALLDQPPATEKEKREDRKYFHVTDGAQ